MRGRNFPSAKESVILDILCRNRREMYGLQIVAASRDKLRRGTFYTTIQRMEQKGFVTSRQAVDQKRSGLPLRMYKPTVLGRKVLALRKRLDAL
jgi:DNA-binding PadR family transcriptional regulator